MARHRPFSHSSRNADPSDSRQPGNQEDLRAMTDRYRAILAAVPDIIMEVDINKVYTWGNESGRTFFGDDVIGRQACDYFVGEQDTYERVKPLSQGSGDTIYVESWQRRQDGEARLLAWWCRPLNDAEGHVTGSLSTARDITEIRQAEEEIHQLNATLEQRVQDRTEELRRAVHLMAGREIRMVELKEVVRVLREQLIEAGIAPKADDPLVERPTTDNALGEVDPGQERET